MQQEITAKVVLEGLNIHNSVEFTHRCWALDDLESAETSGIFMLTFSLQYRAPSLVEPHLLARAIPHPYLREPPARK